VEELFSLLELPSTVRVKSFSVRIHVNTQFCRTNTADSTVLATVPSE